jgi:myosin heavy subunit
MLEQMYLRGIHVMCLPAHCTQVLQPLDVYTFSHFKAALKKAIENWSSNTWSRDRHRKFNETDLGLCVQEAYDESHTRTKSIRAFREAGLPVRNQTIEELKEKRDQICAPLVRLDPRKTKEKIMQGLLAHPLASATEVGALMLRKPELLYPENPEAKDPTVLYDDGRLLTQVEAFATARAKMAKKEQEQREKQERKEEREQKAEERKKEKEDKKVQQEQKKQQQQREKAEKEAEKEAQKEAKIQQKQQRQEAKQLQAEQERAIKDKEKQEKAAQKQEERARQAKEKSEQAKQKKQVNKKAKVKKNKNPPPFSTFCICGDDSKEEDYIECSGVDCRFGGWIHPSCVRITDEQLHELVKNNDAKYCCPFCAVRAKK